ncbi:MAG: DUF1573 domain-containing protein [Sumerlaeia bacterium]
MTGLQGEMENWPAPEPGAAEALAEMTGEFDGREALAALNGARLLYRESLSVEELRIARTPVLLLPTEGSPTAWHPDQSDPDTMDHWSGEAFVLLPPITENGPAQPVFHLASGKVDLGTVPDDRTASAVFAFRNDGDADLRILNTQTSCGYCTVADVELPLIPPGATGSLQASIRTSGNRGAANYSITVKTNDPDNPLAVLEITGVVSPPLSWQPRSLNLGFLTGEQAALGPPPQRVVLSLAYDRPLIVEVANPEESLLILEEVGRREQAGQGVWDLPLTFRLKPDLSPGKHVVHTELTTNWPEYERVSLPVRVEKAASLYPVPEELFFGLVRERGIVSRTLVLTGSGHPRLLSWKSGVNGLSVEAGEPTDEGLTLKVSLDVERAGSGVIRGELELSVDHGGTRELRVPVTGLLKVE